MNKALSMFATALVMAQASAAYAVVKQCDFSTPISAQGCTDGTRTGQASCDAGPSIYHYAVNFQAGANNAQGVLLDVNGNRISECLRASDTTKDGLFGAQKSCTVNVSGSGKKFRIAIS